MKKTHLFIIYLLSIILVSTLTWGALHLYADRHTLPDGVSVGGLSVGGMDKDTAIRKVDQQLNLLKQRPLLLTDDDGATENISLTLGEAGITYEAQAFRDAAQSLGTGHLFSRVRARLSFKDTWHITSARQIGAVQTHLGADWEKQHFGTPVNAVRKINDLDQISYIPGQSVRRIDWTQLDKELARAAPADFAETNEPVRIPLTFAVLEPDITVAQLKAEGIDRKIVQFSTSLGSSSEGRTFNVNSAAQTINGMILKPGEIFDYGKVIAKAEKAYGFREAPVIVNGHLESGIGGGICQVSSTVYNAALRTGLDIVERRNHSLPVHYLPKGQDATFASGSINFRFKNSTGKHLMIQSAIHNRTLIVKFFGTFPADLSYDIESSIVQTLSVPENQIRSDSLSPGAYQVLQQGKPGYVVETYRIKKINGEPVGRSRITRDTYRPQKRVIAVHPSSRTPKSQDNPDSGKPIVEDGVSTP